MDDFVKKIQERRIDGKYSLISKIGEGGHGAVYLGMFTLDCWTAFLSLNLPGENFETDEQVALKLVHCRNGFSSLEEEVETYHSFEGLPGFPKLYSYSERDDYKVMVLDLLGPSLEDLFVFCDRKFSLKTTLMLIDQLLERFQALHSKKYIHRDVKPQNCLLGSGRNGNVVYLTDFGLSREIMTIKEGDDEVLPKHPRLVGTTRYASIRGHLGYGKPNYRHDGSDSDQGYSANAKRRLGIPGLYDDILLPRQSSLARTQGTRRQRKGPVSDGDEEVIG